MKNFSSKAFRAAGFCLAVALSAPAWAEKDVAGEGGGVVEMPLAERAAGPVGILSPGEAGFLGNPWQGYDRESMLESLDLVRRLPPSPVLARMTRDALLADAAFPDQAGPDDGALVLGRIRALLRAGFLVDASVLAQAWPGLPVREDLARTLVEAMFLAGENDAACVEAQAMRNVFSGGFWLKARTVCQFLAGESRAGMLGIDILRDRGEDPDFLAVADAMLGEGGDVARLADPDALALAFMRVAKIPPLGVETRGRPVMMAALALSSEASPQARLEAGIGLSALGIWDGRILSRVLAQVPFDEREIREVDKASGDAYGIRMLPLVVRALSRPRLGNDDGRRAKLLLQAMARMPVVAGGVADVFRDLFAPLVPAQAVDAGVEASALFYLGRQDELAGAWRDALVDAGRPDAVRLWPLAVLAGHAGMDGFPAWLSFHEGRGGDPAARAGRVLSILDGMGQAIPLALRVKFLPETKGAGSDAVLSAAMAMAAGKGQQGRSILLAGRLLPQGIRGADVQDLAFVLARLREAGLSVWADAMAREAMAPLL